MVVNRNNSSSDNNDALAIHGSNKNEYPFRQMLKVCDIACGGNIYAFIESDAKELSEKLVKAVTD